MAREVPTSPKLPRFCYTRVLVWRPGSKLLHPFNPELGIGVVREVDGRERLLGGGVYGLALGGLFSGEAITKLTAMARDRAALHCVSSQPAPAATATTIRPNSL